jgi:hypothetical protein
MARTTSLWRFIVVLWGVWNTVSVVDVSAFVYSCLFGTDRLVGFRHLPLHDSQLSQYLFSTLYVRINIRDIA